MLPDSVKVLPLHSISGNHGGADARQHRPTSGTPSSCQTCSAEPRAGIGRPHSSGGWRRACDGRRQPAPTRSPDISDSRPYVSNRTRVAMIGWARSPQSPSMDLGALCGYGAEMFYRKCEAHSSHRSAVKQACALPHINQTPRGHRHGYLRGLADREVCISARASEIDRFIVHRKAQPWTSASSCTSRSVLGQLLLQYLQQERWRLRWCRVRLHPRHHPARRGLLYAIFLWAPRMPARRPSLLCPSDAAGAARFLGGGGATSVAMTAAPSPLARSSRR